MSYTYARRKNTGDAVKGAGPAQGPNISELAAGARPTSAQMGSRVDLPGEIREKMEQSFGADFSNVRLYESQTVADAGAEAVTQGNNIAFAPGKLDLTSTAGQALLGHELSHVVSQSRGESAGQGFLNDAHLEAQADRQGEMAARGESAYQGPVSPVGASSAMSAAGPMQAKKKKKEPTNEEKLAMLDDDTAPGEVSRGSMSHARRIRNALEASNREIRNPGSGVEEWKAGRRFVENATAGDKALEASYFNNHDPGDLTAIRNSINNSGVAADPLTKYEAEIFRGGDSIRQLMAARRRYRDTLTGDTD